MRIRRTEPNGTYVDIRLTTEEAYKLYDILLWDVSLPILITREEAVDQRRTLVTEDVTEDHPVYIAVREFIRSMSRKMSDLDDGDFGRGHRSNRTWVRPRED